MCKTVFVLLVLFTALSPCKAQTFAEWFAQKKTQKKYLALQIAKLQLYLSYLKKGYQIANTGLTTIGKIKDGDFKLHDLFFSDLLRVKPLISDYSKSKKAFTDIEIIRDMSAEIKRSLVDNSFYNNAEKKLIQGQLDAMLLNLLEDAYALSEVLTSGSLKMNDQERLNRIDGIALTIASKKDWITRISKDYYLLYQQRRKNLGETNMLLELY